MSLNPTISQRQGRRDQIHTLFEAERERITREHRDDDACRTLWRTVIERAVDDIRFLHEHGDRRRLKKHQLERLRRIRENPPREFFQGDWFEQICAFLEVDPDRVRRALAKLDKAA